LRKEIYSHERLTCFGEEVEGHVARLRNLGSFLKRDGGLIAHGGQDGDEQFLPFVKLGVDLVAKFTLGKLNIILGGTVTGHERKEPVVDIDELELGAMDVGYVHVMGRGRQIFELLVGEDVNANEVDLGVAVFTRLGRGHIDDLAGAALDNNEAILPQRRALYGVGKGSPRGGLLEGMLVLLIIIISHGDAWIPLKSSEER